MTLKDLYWAAGFIEGEGSFYAYNGCPAVRVGQKDKQPLERLVSILGGKLITERRKYKGLPNDIYIWQRNGKHAAAIMMTLYPLMSDRRKEKIVEALTIWKYEFSFRNPDYWKRNRSTPSRYAKEAA